MALTWSELLSPLKNIDFKKIFITKWLPVQPIHIPMTKCLKKTHKVYCLTAIQGPCSNEKPLSHYITFLANKNLLIPNHQQKPLRFLCHKAHFEALYLCAWYLLYVPFWVPKFFCLYLQNLFHILSDPGQSNLGVRQITNIGVIDKSVNKSICFGAGIVGDSLNWNNMGNPVECF